MAAKVRLTPRRSRLLDVRLTARSPFEGDSSPLDIRRSFAVEVQ
jgi:hypothetical protein